MDVVFLKKFSKDLDKINKPKDLQSILEVIELVKQAQGFSEVPGTKKLKGYEDAFRIRSGDYRIGVFVSEELVEFARVAHRKDIYKIFP
ncbi:type II toxin-antitoxin system RelE/ParE family toxin [Marivirga sp.]|uniref:type II toxin-antitoxin system RelE family toxin n=1 Tax=Marivirga sp. TaxID=2018662 RepID=UPI0025FDA07E|nr:type II toxin-antitoxin system RelE/ParE family toxin [Marivirga sp.]